MSRTVSDYLAEICQEQKVPGVYAFRGQRDSSWPLRSAAARRLLRHYHVDSERAVPSFSRVYVEYHQNVLINPACTRGLGLENGRKLSELEILAKLQHFGAATGLLDFTYSPLIALWFACQNEKHDGKVFSINTTDPIKFGNISHQVDVDGKIAKLLSPDADDSLPWIWEPVATGDAETRVLIQHSLFVIGRPSIAEDVARAVVIRKEDKERLRNELDTIHAIREETLFKDVYGFASVNGALYPIPTFESAERYFLFGNRNFQDGDYQGAIDNYDQAIRLQPDHAAAHNNRGVAKDKLGRHEEAIADCDEALRLQPGLVRAYLNRGKAKVALGRTAEARRDYERALALAQRGWRRQPQGRYRGEYSRTR